MMNELITVDQQVAFEVAESMQLLDRCQLMPEFSSLLAF